MKKVHTIAKRIERKPIITFDKTSVSIVIENSAFLTEGYANML